MARDSYDTIKSKLRTLTQFDNGNSMWSFTNAIGEYWVYSYRTLIAVVYPDGTYWMDDRKFSVTTSKQQTYIRAAFANRERITEFV